MRVRQTVSSSRPAHPSPLAGAALLEIVRLDRGLFQAGDGVRDRRAELGYWLAQPAWGNGFATEAAEAAIDFGFARLGLARIYAQVLADNRASLRVLDKLGMVNEGVKRQHVHKARRLHDVVLYGLLRDEWTRR